MTDLVRWEGWFGRQKETAAGRRYQAAYLGKKRLDDYEANVDTLGSYVDNMKQPISMEQLREADQMIIDSIE